MSKSIESITVEIVPDQEPDVSWLTDKGRYDDLSNTEKVKALVQDEERLAAFTRGDWSMVGVRAKADIIVTVDHGNRKSVIFETITSPGLWSIESDSDDSYFERVGLEECDTLRRMLLELGFTEVEIADHAPAGIATPRNS